jgi:hypothetical protein
MFGRWGHRCLGLSLGFVLSFALGSISQVEANEVRQWTEQNRDKISHFGAAATAQSLCYSIGKVITGSKWGTTLTCFAAINAAGLMKEAVDPFRGGHREVKDVYANLAGSGLSATLISIGF